MISTNLTAAGINVATSTQGRWPGPLELIHQHPFLVSTAFSVLTIIFLGMSWFREQVNFSSKVTSQAPRAVGNKGRVSILGEVPRQVLAFRARSQISMELGNSETSSVLVMLGPPGVGKTQCAVAYAHRRADEGWRMVAWVNADAESHIIADLEQIAARQGISTLGVDPREAARDALRYMESLETPSLIVFDNATDADTVADWLPNSGSVKTLITTTRRQFDALGTTIPVGPFDLPEAVAYLRAGAGAGRGEDFESLAEELGCLPLALAQASALMRKQQITSAEYVEKLQGRSAEESLRRVPGDPHPYGAATAINIAVSSVEAEDPTGNTKMVLEQLSLLSTAGVARPLLYLLNAKTPADLSNTRGTIDESLGVLAEASIVSFSSDSSSVLMHRMTSRVIRDRMRSVNSLHAVAGATIEGLFHTAIPVESGWAGRRNVWELADQTTALWLSLQEVHNGERLSADLKSDVLSLRGYTVRLMVETGELEWAVAMGREVLADRNAEFGPNNVDTLTSMINLSGALRLAGRLDEAIDLGLKGLKGRSRVLGSRHLETDTARRNLADAYEQAGSTFKAITLYENVVSNRERINGQESDEALEARLDLAGALSSAGETTRAIGMLESVIDTIMRVHNGQHCRLVSARLRLGAAFRDVDRLDDAVAVYEQVLSDFGDQIENDDPDVLAARSDLAGVYETEGRTEEAVEMYEDIFDKSLHAVGLKHPVTLTYLNNLAGAYRSAGYLRDAIVAYEATLDFQSQILFEDHPNIIATRNNLACAYLSGGRIGNAISMHMEAAEASSRILGPDHPRTISILSDLNVAEDARLNSRASKILALLRPFAMRRRRKIVKAGVVRRLFRRT